MGQHSKYSFEMKLAAVTKYLEGSCSTESIARNLGTNGTRIIEWATIYQSLGAKGLKLPKSSSYSAETKRSAVYDYLSGKGTLREIQKKYGINGKAYLSAILDLADKSIVSFVIGSSNRNDAKHVKSIPMHR